MAVGAFSVCKNNAKPKANWVWRYVVLDVHKRTE